MAETYPRYGVALVASGPSGTGKTTMCRQLLAGDPALQFSVSCTTRPPRSGEVDGRDYHFISRETFAERVAAGDFLEHATVHDNAYGTLKSEVVGHLEAGRDVLLDIDVQGANQVRQAMAGQWWAHCVQMVFVGPPSYTELERRLRGRGTDSDSVIRRRLDNARAELQQWKAYDRVIVNRQLDRAVADLAATLAALRLRTDLVRAEAPWELC